jgi:hypothetical protein
MTRRGGLRPAELRNPIPGANADSGEAEGFAGLPRRAA